MRNDSIHALATPVIPRGGGDLCFERALLLLGPHPVAPVFHPDMPLQRVQCLIPRSPTSSLVIPGLFSLYDGCWGHPCVCEREREREVSEGIGCFSLTAGPKG